MSSMDEKTKILYIDDEDINLQLFEINFSDKYHVMIADNGFAGLEILDENPDVLTVISDMKMPGMNGIEFIKKAKEKFPQKHFYIITGFDSSPEICEAIESQLILKQFRKPYDKNEIERALNEMY